ncbi:hypothetical protein B566_EDAN017399 [Ephemera danica]|nr:hypothetical protein B566_EDAN017399 [Ephemera danica]
MNLTPAEIVEVLYYQLNYVHSDICKKLAATNNIFETKINQLERSISKLNKGEPLSISPAKITVTPDSNKKNDNTTRSNKDPTVTKVNNRDGTWTLVTNGARIKSPLNNPEIPLSNRFVSLTSEHENNFHSTTYHSDCYNINFVEGDIYDAPRDYCYVQCVSEDLHCGAGIAAQFKAKYGGIEYMKAQNKTVCDIAVLPIEEERYLINLITKAKYFHKPTINSIERCLWQLKYFCNEFGVKKLAMPLIACGLDKQPWDQVQKILEKNEWNEWSTENTGKNIKVYTAREKRTEWPPINFTEQPHRIFTTTSPQKSPPPSRKTTTSSSSTTTIPPHKNPSPQRNTTTKTTPPQKSPSTSRKTTTSISSTTKVPPQKNPSPQKNTTTPSSSTTKSPSHKTPSLPKNTTTRSSTTTIKPPHKSPSPPHITISTVKPPPKILSPYKNKTTTPITIIPPPQSSSSTSTSLPQQQSQPSVNQLEECDDLEVLLDKILQMTNAAVTTTTTLSTTGSTSDSPNTTLSTSSILPITPSLTPIKDPLHTPSMEDAATDYRPNVRGPAAPTRSLMFYAFLMTFIFLYILPVPGRLRATATERSVEEDLRGDERPVRRVRRHQQNHKLQRQSSILTLVRRRCYFRSSAWGCLRCSLVRCSDHNNAQGQPDAGPRMWFASHVRHLAARNLASTLARARLGADLAGGVYAVRHIYVFLLLALSC